MEIDTRFPAKLDQVSDAPEPLRGALIEGFQSGEPARLLVHSPAFLTDDGKLPATVLAVTNNRWLLVSETENGVTVERSNFSDILFLELTSILLLGQLRIFSAAGDASHSVTIDFEAIGDEFYREAIDLMLAGIEEALPATAGKGQNEVSFQAWPIKFRNEAQRYRTKGQRLLDAIQWPAILGESQQQLVPAGALLVAERELVLISEEKRSSAESPSAGESPQDATPSTGDAESEPPKLPGDVYEFGDIVTFVPRVRLTDSQISHQEHSCVLTLHVQAAQGGAKLEILLPSDDETAVLKAMEQGLIPRCS